MPIDSTNEKLIIHDRHIEASNNGLRARALSKYWRQKPVLHDVSLEIKRGEAVGLLGPNGAGKTTCFYILCGLSSPNSGQVLLDGVDITKLPLYRRARLGVGYLPQEPSAFRGMSVEGNLLAAIELTEPARTKRRELVDNLLSDFGLEHIRKTPAQAFRAGSGDEWKLQEPLPLDLIFYFLTNPSQELTQ